MKELNSNFNNTNAMINQNIFNMNSDNSFYIPENHPLSIIKLNQLNAFLINKEYLKNDSICIICLETFRLREKYILLPCIHYYHEKCIKRWFERSNKCPICHYNVEENDII